MGKPSRDTWVLGVDPGKSGGMAWVGCGVGARKMPDTERDVWEFFQRGAFGEHFALIEKVHAMPGQGVTSMFNFGVSYGQLRMALIAASIPFETVSPAKWQRSFGLPTLKDAGSGTAKKNAHKAKAQELFPSLRVTHAIADALLIAEYGRRTRAGGSDA